MNNWQKDILDKLEKTIFLNHFWEKFFRPDEKGPFVGAIHLAVLVEPYLNYILHGQKTIETRFSANRCAPFQRVEPGDVILLKRTGGPIIGICQARYAWFYNLEPNSWREIKSHAREICADDPLFWESRKDASYATLIRIHNVESISPISVEKRDRRGWVVVQEPIRGPLLT
jgi:hypothetical protein